MLAALVAVLIFVAQSAPTYGGEAGGTPSQADNKIPDGMIVPDQHAAEQQASLAKKEALLTKIRSGEVVIQGAEILAVPGVDQHPCGAWCGQAATQAIFNYKGQYGFTLDQVRAMEVPSATSCDSGMGTCIVSIRDTLNANTPGLPWTNFYHTKRLNHTSLYEAAKDLESLTKSDVYYQRMPLIALTNPNPPDGTPYCLPGWCGVSADGHYLTINGYDGVYDGSDASAATYYRDSWYNPADQHWATLNTFADTIYYKDGNGSCSAEQYNVIW